MKAFPLIFLFSVWSCAQDGTGNTANGPERIRLAATRAVAIVQRSANGFYESQSCFSCHSHGPPMMTFRMARERVSMQICRPMRLDGFA